MNRPRSPAPPNSATRYGGVLLVAQSPVVVEGVRRALTSCPRLVIDTADTFDGVRNRLGEMSPALVLIHLGAANEDALVATLLKEMAIRPHQPSVLILCDSWQIERGITLLNQGATDYLEWPRDSRRLVLLAELMTSRPAPLPTPASPPVTMSDETHELIYTPGSALGRIMDQLTRVAPVQTTVLFQGETGTGKTMLARILHDRSAQCAGPFVEVNCAAVPESLFESELFGHTKGAFTGAVGERMGRIRAAANGTLFLDEIDTLSLTSQAKLLRVLQSGAFEPVGSDAPQKMENVRLVVACNKVLEDEVRAGRFRADLLYRLAVVKFSVPPLREQDPVFFATLVHRFLREFATKARRVISGISPDALAVLQRESWPGNVRQLRNVIERAVALRPGGMIGLDDLPDELRSNEELTPWPDSQTVADPTLTDVKGLAEKSQIVAILRKTQNNRSRTAAELGISRNTLYLKLRQYGLLDRTF